MPRNNRGGNKAKKGANKNTREKKRPLPIRNKDDDSNELYGVVVKRCGGRPPYVDVDCSDNIQRRCVVRGKMQKRVWINPGDIVLITYDRKLNDNKGEIEVKLTQTEISKLKAMGELKDLNPDNNKEENESFQFVDDDESDTESKKVNKISNTMYTELEKKNDFDIDFDDI